LIVCLGLFVSFHLFPPQTLLSPTCMISSPQAAVLMKKADKMSLSNTATREGLAKHVATSQNANGLLFLAWLNAPR